MITRSASLATTLFTIPARAFFICSLLNFCLLVQVEPFGVNLRWLEGESERLAAAAMSLVKLLQDATGKRSLRDIVKQAGVYIVRSSGWLVLVLPQVSRYRSVNASLVASSSLIANVQALDGNWMETVAQLSGASYILGQIGTARLRYHVAHLRLLSSYSRTNAAGYFCFQRLSCTLDGGQCTASHHL